MPDRPVPGAPDHYYTASPTAPSEPQQIRWELPGLTVILDTDRGVFSRGKVDRGTDLLARTMQLPATGEILDLGAGYGPLGVLAALRSPEAHVTLVEVNERAAHLAEENLRRLNLTNAEVLVGDAPAVLGARHFDVVVTNPPVRAGKVEMFRLFRDAHQRLRPGGVLWFVMQTKQGAKTMARDLGEQFASVEEMSVKGGFRVYRAVKA